MRTLCVEYGRKVGETHRVAERVNNEWAEKVPCRDQGRKKNGDQIKYSSSFIQPDQT
jgi:hypothetical protein